MGNTKGVSYNGNLYYYYLNYLKSWYSNSGAGFLSRISLLEWALLFLLRADRVSCPRASTTQRESLLQYRLRVFHFNYFFVPSITINPHVLGKEKETPVKNSIRSFRLFLSTFSRERACIG